MSGTWLGSGAARRVFILGFRLFSAKPILFRLRLVGAEFLLRRADDADLGFRTRSIGIVFGTGCLILSATINPARVLPTCLPRKLKITGAMFVLLLKRVERLGRFLGRTVGRQPSLSGFSGPGHRSIFLARRRDRL